MDTTFVGIPLGAWMAGVTALATVTLAALTWRYVVLTGRLAEAARDSAEASRVSADEAARAADAAERAVIVEAMPVLTVGQRGRSARGTHVEWSNDGRTRALNVRVKDADGNVVQRRDRMLPEKRAAGFVIPGEVMVVTIEYDDPFGHRYRMSVEDGRWSTDMRGADGTWRRLMRPSTGEGQPPSGPE